MTTEVHHVLQYRRIGAPTSLVATAGYVHDPATGLLTYVPLGEAMPIYVYGVVWAGVVPR